MEIFEIIVVNEIIGSYRQFIISKYRITVSIRVLIIDHCVAGVKLSQLKG